MRKTKATAVPVFPLWIFNIELMTHARHRTKKAPSSKKDGAFL
jgi:hypothetical protein